MTPFPWLVKEAVADILEFLKYRNKPSVLEFGSGRSTIFFSQYVSYIVFVDHDPHYYDVVTKEINLKGIKNIRLCLHPRPYNVVCNKLTDSSYDLILVDGRDRNQCIFSCERKLIPNGMIVLDNSERPRYKEGIKYLLDIGYKEKKYFGNDGYQKSNWQTSLFRLE